MNPQVVGSAARFGVHHYGAQFQVEWREKCCRTPCGGRVGNRLFQVAWRFNHWI